MARDINRRDLILTGGLGLAALTLAGPSAAALLTATGFTHNVASGEPGPDSILLWTRYVPGRRGDASARHKAVSPSRRSAARDQNRRAKIATPGAGVSPAMGDLGAQPPAKEARARAGRDALGSLGLAALLIRFPALPDF